MEDPKVLAHARLVHAALRRVIRWTGYDIVRRNMAPLAALEYPPDFGSEHISIIERVRPYTMTSFERLYALIEAVHYITRRAIPGSIVECGVWRGGSMMASALTLQGLGCSDRDLYLFDTFEGMPKPDAVDINYKGLPAMATFREHQTSDDGSAFCHATLPDVQAAMASTGYDPLRVHFIKGKVENTIPLKSPDTIALLRLDTDWYHSTKHELEHLFPRLSLGGILIIDDYGHWRGARKATDEYLAQHAPSLFLNRIDYTGRLSVKTNGGSRTGASACG
jgi:O-methyltransferase